jgi:hypothetical protein
MILIDNDISVTKNPVRDAMSVEDISVTKNPVRDDISVESLQSLQDDISEKTLNSVKILNSQFSILNFSITFINTNNSEKQRNTI